MKALKWICGGICLFCFLASTSELSAVVAKSPGKKLDDAIDKASDKIDDAKKKGQEIVDKTADKIDSALEPKKKKKKR